MKTSTIILLCFLLNLSTLSYSQEAIFNEEEIVSPEIHQDHTVTFRFLAPKANSVQITSDFLPSEKKKTPYGDIDVPIPAAFVKSDNGIWTYTTKKLDSELYTYSLIVDGIKISDPNNPFLIRDVAKISNILLIGGGKADLYKVNDNAHGTITKRWYHSPGLNMNRRITIYTPPGYESSKKEYPVLYLLHGAGGDEESWMELGSASQILDNLIAAGKAKPMIVVMPNGNVSQDAAPGMGIDGYYKPVFLAPKTMNGTYEYNFMDIIKFTEDNYRVIKNKQNRAIAGLSMGGFHAYHISRYFPNTFDYVGLFSAALIPREDASGKVYSNIDEGLKTQMKNGYKLYWIGIGKEDILYKANEEYRKKLDALKMPYEYKETEDGHVWKNWRIYLSEFATKIF